MPVRRTFSTLVSFLLAVLLSCSLVPSQVSFAAADSATTDRAAADVATSNAADATSADAGSKEEPAPGLKDDFYEAVNHDLFEEWEIAAVDSYVDHFSILQGENMRRLLDILDAAEANTSAEVGSDERNVGALWATALDETARNAGGYGRANEFIAQVDAAKDLPELMEVLVTFDRTYSLASFFSLGITPDSVDSSTYVYYLVGADTGLTREEWYSEEPQTKERVQLYKDLLTKLWELNGETPEEAATIAENVTEAMKTLAASSLTVAEEYDPEKSYNPCTLADLEDLYDGILFMEQVYTLYDGEPDDLVVNAKPDLVQAAVEFLTTADLDLVKQYVKSCLFSDLAEMSTMDSQDIYRENYKARMGLEEMASVDTDLAIAVTDQLPFECSRLYADQYFSEDIRDDIQAMIDDIIATYEQRIRSLSWLGDETKEEAITKLQAIEARIGVPDEWPQDAYELNLLRPEEGGLYIDNILAILEASRNASLELKDEPVDDDFWSDPPHVVNAYYDTFTNSIVLLAGILQPPFYDTEATPEEQLAYIGVIIAHELSHAFDSSGSQYDENGNLRDWWTEEDAEQFEALSQQVVAYYDGQEIDGMAMDGELTLFENIADLGAVACITEVAQKRGYNLADLYRAYATLWAEEMRPELRAELLAIDPHAPNKIRVNAVLSATDGFYEAFDIQEGDGMYVAPEDRPRIW